MKQNKTLLISVIAVVVAVAVTASAQSSTARRRTWPTTSTTTTTTVRSAGTTTTVPVSRPGAFTLPPLDLSRTADVTIYTDGAGKLTLKPIPANAGYYIELKGNSSYKVLWFKIEKPGYPSHDLKLFLTSSRDFDVYYIFKDGTGDYTVTVLGADSLSASSYKGLAKFTVKSTTAKPSDIPNYFLNDRVLQFVTARVGQTVGRGECWDVAQEALDTLGADWRRTTDFGLPLNPRTDEIKPGDIIQFKSVKLFEDTPTYTRTSYIGSPDHTSIVYEVLGPLHYKLAHQNVGGKRYIVIEDVNLNFMVSGQMWFYRPVMGLFTLADLNR